MKRFLLLIAPIVFSFAACTKSDTNDTTPATEDTTTEKPTVKPPPDVMGSEVYYFTDSMYLTSNAGVVEQEDNTAITTKETVELNITKDQIIMRGHIHHKEPGRNVWSNTGRLGTSNDYFYSEVSKDGKVVRYYLTSTNGSVKSEIRIKGEILE